MKSLIDKLYSDIIELIQRSDEKKVNELRYKIGEVISVFYADNKEGFKNKAASIEEGIVKFYEDFEIKQDQLKTDKYKKLAPWDKIKIALSGALKKDALGEGYSTTNLGSMQQFYRKYRNLPESLELAYKLDWSHNVELVKGKINEDEHKFYLKNAVNEKWSLKELKKQIEDERYDDFLRVLEESGYKYKVKNLYITNYKSLIDTRLNNPSPFLVFAGANASGKSSIFEAIELLMHSSMTADKIAFDIFGGDEKIVNFRAQKPESKESLLTIKLGLEFEYNKNKETIDFGLNYNFATKNCKKNLQK